ncbi:NAD(P)-binding protein [Backusella circina FSU 941]|nr:NAD(P)-binding protein [Backusella circina FSU 941]
MGFFIRSIVRQHSRLYVRAYTTEIQAKALVYANHGQPSEVLKLHTYRLPALTPNTVQVEFLASPINPADINMIQGVYPIKPKFQTLGTEELAVGGNEGVAKVIAVGSNVDSLKVGDEVVMAKAGHGTWRTHAEGPADDFQLLPKSNVSLVQKATIAVNPCTAYRMLKDFVNLKKGDYVIQNGGNSAVGQAVIQIANAWGINTINVVRDRPEIEKLRQELTDLGATHVVTDDKLGSFETRKSIKSWVDNSSLLLGLNCVGGKSATDMARYLGNNGQYVTYGAMSRAPLSLPASLLIFKNISFHGFWVSKWSDIHSKEERYEMFQDLIDLMSQGKLAEPKWTKLEFEDEESLKRAADQGISGYATGKQVIVF